MQEDRHDPRFGPGGPRSQPPAGHTWPPEVGHPSPWVALTVAMPSPLQAHTATPAELQERIEAERGGRPFLVFRDGDGAQPCSRPRGAREHRPRQRRRRQLPWTRRSRACMPSSSRSPGNGRSATTASRATAPTSTARDLRAHRLRDGDVVRVGKTCSPTAARSPRTRCRPRSPASAHARRPAAEQRQVLVALARPYKHDEFAMPATNQAIADELHLSVDAVKSHLRMLFQRFGSSTCHRTRSARGWWPRRCRRASSRPRDL